MVRPDDWPATKYDVPLAQALHDIGAGRRAWPADPKKKRHHFVPRFVLANFADEAPARRIIQMDKRTGTCVPVTPEKAASRDRFYAVQSDQSPTDNRIEDFLSFVEGYAAGPIRRLIDEPSELTEADRTTISLLLALQERRTPYGIADAGAMVEQRGRDFMAGLVRDPEAFAEHWAKATGQPTSAEELDRVRAEVLSIATEDRMHLTTKRDQGLLVMMDTWLEAAERIDLMRWDLLRPTGDQRFIQNDQGVARLDSSTDFRPGAGPPTWFFPLAPDRCLLVHPGPRSLVCTKCTPRGVTDLNLRVYGWSERFIFGRSQHDVQTVRRAAKAQPRKAAGPPR